MTETRQPSLLAEGRGLVAMIERRNKLVNRGSQVICDGIGSVRAHNCTPKANSGRKKRVNRTYRETNALTNYLQERRVVAGPAEASRGQYPRLRQTMKLLATIPKGSTPSE